MKQLNDAQIPNVAPEDHQIIVIGPHVWGAGHTLAEALKHMKRVNNSRACNYEAHVVPLSEDDPVNDMGQFYSCAQSKHCPYCQ